MDGLKVLRKFGLSEYEARAYLSLAKLGPATVREVVLDSKLPRNKAYEALQKLEDKNKVVSLPVSPKKYKISNPELFKEEVFELGKSVDEFIKLVQQPRNDNFKDLFWVLKGQKAIVEKMAAENVKCTKEILACAKLSRPFYKSIRVMRDAVKRGVKVHIICTFEEGNIKTYEDYLNAGAKLRVFNEKKFGPLLPRIGVFDRNAARLTIGKPEVQDHEDYITLWTESKAFIEMLRNQFMNMWKECKPIEGYIKKAKR